MTETDVLAVCAALSQGTRLKIVRLLVVTGPEGLTAGEIGAAMEGASSSRMSFHLSHLERAGLLTSRREGRHIRYVAHMPVLQGFIDFLVRDCCQGRPEACGPVVPAPCEGAPQSGQGKAP